MGIRDEIEKFLDETKLEIDQTRLAGQMVHIRTADDEIRSVQIKGVLWRPSAGRFEIDLEEVEVKIGNRRSLRINVVFFDSRTGWHLARRSEQDIGRWMSTKTDIEIF
jgi:hypothetical protein